MEDYRVHTITFHPFNADTVSGVLWSLPIEGITEDESCLRVYSKVSSNIQSKDVTEVLNSLVNQNLIENYKVEEGTEKQQNWNAYWESRLNIIHVTDRITIKPTSKQYEPGKDEIVITIDPKMSFGTGEHETTKLCLEYVEKYTAAGNKILDLGSGTGILAIAAAKLGAAKVFAADNDEWCLDNGRENVLLNSAEGKVEIVLGEIDAVQQDNFDMVIANINKNVLMTLGSETAQKIRRAGKLIISGFYKIDVDELTNYFSNYGFEFVEQNSLNNWCSIVLKRL